MEIVNKTPSKHVDLGGDQRDVTHEAYVTFKHSSDAYKAIRSEVFPKNIINLVPADTWHQPDYKTDKHKPFKGLIECNHRCEKRSQEQEISRAFDDLSIQDQDILCDHMVTEFVLELKPGTKLNTVRRMLRGIRPYVGNLSLNLHAGFDDDALDECIDQGSFQRRVMEVIGMNGAGPKLTEMKIDGIGGFTTAMLECLAPLLRPLEALTIDTNYCNVLYLLPKFCPNLYLLRMLSEDWKGESAAVQAWPSLKCMLLRSVTLDVDSDSDSGRKFRQFLSQNPQIESMELDIIVDTCDSSTL